MPRKPNVECIICKKPIYRRPFELKKTEGKVYCSQVCYGKSCRKPKPCVVCGEEVLASKNRKTCSKKCSLIWNKDPNRNHSKGRKKSKTPRWPSRSFRKLFLEERGAKCEVCNYNKTPVLSVHHIIERSNGGTDDWDNLILLCRNCHGEVHCGLLDLESIPDRRAGTVC